MDIFHTSLEARMLMNDPEIFQMSNSQVVNHSRSAFHINMIFHQEKRKLVSLTIIVSFRISLMHTTPNMRLMQSSHLTQKML